MIQWRLLRSARFVVMIVLTLAIVPAAWANCLGSTSGAQFVSTLDTAGSADSGGALSGFPAPYGTVTVGLISSSEACIQFNSGSSGGFTYMFIDTNAADVNVNATSFTAVFASATGPSTGGFSSPSFVSFGSGNVDGEGSFNLTTKMFDGTDHPATDIEFTVTNTSSTWTSAGDVLTANSDGFDAAAHVVVFDSTNVVNGQQITTGFVGESGGGIVAGPEPSAAMLLGYEFLGLGLFAFARKRFRRKA